MFFRSFQEKSLVLVLCGFAINFSTVKPLAAGDTEAGYIVALQGTVTAQRAEILRPLLEGGGVFVDDTIDTSVASRVDVQLGPDIYLQVGPSSSVAIADFGIDQNLQLQLRAGAVLVDKAPQSSARPMLIDSAFGQVVVRGTKLYVGPSRGPFSVLVLEGRVELSAGGTTIALIGGEGSEVATQGAPPSAPVIWADARKAEALAPFR